MSAIKVHLRPVAMRLAAEWLDAQIAADASVREAIEAREPQFLGFVDQLRKHGTSGASTKRIDIDRALAERIVTGLRDAILDVDSRHLLQTRKDGELPPPVDGQEALVEIMLDVRAALTAKGRPRAEVDPLEAFAVNEGYKRSRRRADRYNPSDYSVERTAEKLGVSKNTAAAAIVEGREAAAIIAEAKRKLPAGARIIWSLIDYKSKTAQFEAVAHAKRPRAK